MPILKKRHIIRAGIFLILLGVGYGLGNVLGRGFIRSFISRGSFHSFLLARPEAGYFKTYALVNSVESIDRLTGYYAMDDLSLVDQEFLKERIIRDRDPVNQNTLFWLLTMKGVSPDLIAFFQQAYGKGTAQLKSNILDYLYVHDRKTFTAFVKEFNIPKRRVRAIIRKARSYEINQGEL